MKKFNVLIVGAGRIGALFDNPSSKQILTHAHAAKKHKNFNLIGFVDKDKENLDKAAKLWGCKAFSTIKEAFSRNKIDLVCITTPDHLHFETIKQVLEFPVKIILAEKPLAANVEEAQNIIKLSKSKKISIAVNYSRRFVDEINNVKSEIKNGHYGAYLTGSGYYGKGLLHNGSHMIDLLRMLLGEIKSCQNFGTINDYKKTDPSVSVRVEFSNNKSFFLNAINCKKFTIFEADFIFEKARIRIVDYGFVIEKYFVKNDEIFAGYKKLALKKSISTSLGLAMYNAFDNIANFLTKKEPLKCSVEDGYKAIEIISKIK